MSIETEILARSNSNCELCGANDKLMIFNVLPSVGRGMDEKIHLCSTCLDQIDNPENTDPNHWRCLNDSMWSAVPGVQVVAWRMLNRLANQGWPKDLLDMLYLDDETRDWAKATGEGIDQSDVKKHVDSNGAILETGDTVILTKSIDVKGSSLTAKRGTAVRKISLVTDNHEQIEGKVEGQMIVILTKFVKKAK